MSKNLDGMKRVPEHVRKNLEDDYVQLMVRHKAALTKAYPVGLKFQKNYIQVLEELHAKWVIVRTKFSWCEYEHLTWSASGVVYSFYIYYKKLDKRGRPNGKEQVVDHRQFDAGCTVLDSNNEK